VLDRSSNKENVYMLSMIDEDDLAEFVTETKKQETEQPTVITPQPETKPAVEETEKEPEKESKETNTGDVACHCAACRSRMRWCLLF
jgi:hypothetical protein